MQALRKSLPEPGARLPAQEQACGPSLLPYNMLRRYRRQSRWFHYEWPKSAEGNSDLNNAKYVTVTIGGNDLGFSRTLTQCISARWTGASLDFKCANDVRDAFNPNSSKYKLGELKESLKAIYVKIRAAAPNAKILVTGASAF